MGLLQICSKILTFVYLIDILYTVLGTTSCSAPPPPTRKLSSAPTAATDASAGKERTSAEWRCRVIEQAMRMQSPGSGDYAGAEFLFGPDGLHPFFWGVTKLQLEEFGKEVHVAQAAGEIVNYTPPNLPAYPDDVFSDPKRGPNMHQVNVGFIKPVGQQHLRVEGGAGQRRERPQLLLRRRARRGASRQRSEE